jgi:hypothetical protein
MTPEEFNYIKDSFSQIIDDISGNPDWYEAAKAVASNLGTLERELKKKVISLSSRLNDAYEAGYKAGAEGMAGQGETFNGFMSVKGKRSLIVIKGSSQNFNYGDNIIVQIRKKE